MSDVTPEMMNRITALLPEGEVQEATDDQPAAEEPSEGDAVAADAPAEKPAALSDSEKAKYTQAVRALEKKDVELAAIKKELEALKSAPKGKPKLTKEEFEALAQKYMNGKWDEDDAPEAPQKPLTAEQKRLQEVEAELKAYKEKEAAAEKARLYEENLENLKTYVTEDNPLADFVDWVPAKLYELHQAAVEKGEEPDPEALAKDYANAFISDVRGMFKSERFRKALLSDPEFRAQIASEIEGAETSTQAQQEKPKGTDRKRNGPPVITKRQAAEVPTRTVKTMTDDDRRERALSLLVKSLD